MTSLLKEHQVADWPTHKKVCSLLKTSYQISPNSEDTTANWYRFQRLPKISHFPENWDEYFSLLPNSSSATPYDKIVIADHTSIFMTLYDIIRTNMDCFGDLPRIAIHIIEYRPAVSSRNIEMFGFFMADMLRQLLKNKPIQITYWYVKDAVIVENRSFVIGFEQQVKVTLQEFNLKEFSKAFVSEDPDILFISNFHRDTKEAAKSFFLILDVLRQELLVKCPEVYCFLSVISLQDLKDNLKFLSALNFVVNNDNAEDYPINPFSSIVAVSRETKPTKIEYFCSPNRYVFGFDSLGPLDTNDPNYQQFLKRCIY